MPLGKELRVHRATQVRRLNALAKKCGEQELKDGTAKAIVEALMESKPRLVDTDKKELADAAAQYKESFTKPQKING